MFTLLSNIREGKKKFLFLLYVFARLNVTHPSKSRDSSLKVHTNPSDSHVVFLLVRVRPVGAHTTRREKSEDSDTRKEIRFLVSSETSAAFTEIEAVVTSSK